MKREVRLNNVIFPVWMLLLLPPVWLIVIPGNFIIDSLVFLVSMAIFKVSEKKKHYKSCILKIFGFGFLSDIIGSLYIFLLMYVLELGRMGDELYLTIPALLISAVLIFVFNYFFTFRRFDKGLRFRFAMILAIITAPYTFLIPTSVFY